MATSKRPKGVPGLTFLLTVTPLRNGQPWPGIEPSSSHYDKDVLQWHEAAVDTGVMCLLRDMEQRVRKHVTPQVRGRK